MKPRRVVMLGTVILWMVWLVLCVLLAQCGTLPFSPSDQPHRQRLTSERGYYQTPRWSPDGTQITFSLRNADFHTAILMMDRDGSNLRPLTRPDEDNFNPDWSPDGKRIVFASMRDQITQLYVTLAPSPEGTSAGVNADGSEVTLLTHFDESADYAKWSPDGTRIAFRGSTRKEIDGKNKLFVMNADGTQIVQLIYYPLGSLEQFEWSPDSTRITFVAKDVEADARGPFLYVMNADGSQIRRLNDGIPGSYFPTWSPDGKQILFAFGIEGSKVLRDSGFYLLNLEDSTRRLVLSDATCADPNWSRAKNLLVFVCDRDSYSGQIFTLDMKGIPNPPSPARPVQPQSLPIEWVVFWGGVTLIWGLLTASAVFFVWPKTRDALRTSAAGSALIVRLERAVAAGLISMVIYGALTYGIVSVLVSSSRSVSGSVEYWIQQLLVVVLNPVFMLSTPGLAFTRLVDQIVLLGPYGGILLALVANLVAWFWLGAIPGFMIRRNKLVVITWLVIVGIIEVLGWAPYLMTAAP